MPNEIGAKAVLAMCGIGLLWASGAAAQDVTVQRVTKHAITLSMSNLGMHTNVTVVETQQGLVAIETEITPYIMGKIKEAAEKKLGRDDWAYVINTHAHLHHAGGNCLFPQAQIVGHETMSVDWLRDQLSTGRGRRRFCHTVGVDVAIRNLSTTLKRPGLTLDQKRELRRRLRFCRAVQQEILTGFRVANPTMTFADRHTLDLGDVHLRLIYWGDGIHHSSIFVHVVEDRLLVGMGMAGSWIPDFYGTVTLDGIRRAISLWKEFCAKDAEVDILIGVHAPEPIFSRRQFSPTTPVPRSRAGRPDRSESNRGSPWKRPGADFL